MSEIGRLERSTIKKFVMWRRLCGLSETKSIVLSKPTKMPCPGLSRMREINWP
jgi:hypothetical protein